MLFSLQKILWYLALPPSSLILLMLAGIIMLRRRRNLGLTMIVTGVSLLYVLSLEPVADSLLKPLESAAPPLADVKERVYAVVVPGGGSVDITWPGAKAVPNAETYTRIVKGVELARKLRVPLILTGGNGEPFATTLKDADVMAEAVYAMGMPRSQVIVENRSRNTVENSFEVRKLVKENTIILATSGYYMKRAMLMFKKRGFDIVPAPVYPLAQNRTRSWFALIPQAGSLSRSSVALAEWVSLIWWGVRGEL